MSLAEEHNPIQHFQKWFFEVEKSYPEDEVNIMLLSTIGTDGFPKSRIVLLKRFTWEGFTFFTNYNSEKGIAITNNNKVSLSFNWSKAKKRVHISGYAEKISKNLSEGYFDSRPRGSKLSAWASNQSKVVTSRKKLEEQLLFYQEKFSNKIIIPKPQYWGGYIVKPIEIEFIEAQNHNRNQSITYKLLSNYEWSKDIRHFAV
ncbi:pyridoxamine 5'-phosphate oxidase [Aquimarina algicola]|uniref:Pyridoxamine 5'-phosphate oxidase n=1 Tax=Aquimarina algicola TaxID=2589995 RepID=A0A504J986_9FLAO|nr:pyridoxamine 5'-phosphate oxidase [Aquimarina algicola]TPN87476.1 pyridoxamine 5'-phosphate oxidase [Aquimarina algicola]